MSNYAEISNILNVARKSDDFIVRYDAVNRVLSLATKDSNLFASVLSREVNKSGKATKALLNRMYKIASKW